ncbi:MAG TPA: hypothetical protein DCM05_04320 [Elusimicrobia bacterium]|nr:hypothetical protein [Elusimicrobiota bacterium]
MKCPVCGCDLLASTVNGVRIEGCMRCFGSFSPAASLRKPVKLALPLTGPLRCPVCRKRMVRGRLFKGRLTLDRCSTCAGVWFDEYEIDKLRELSGDEPIGAPGESASPAKGNGAKPAIGRLLPLIALGTLAGVCVLYALLLRLGGDAFPSYHRALTGRLPLVSSASPERSLQPDAILRTVLEAEAIVLWSVIAILAAYLLTRLLAWALPVEERSQGAPPNGWGRHHHVPAEFHADEKFTACLRAARAFVELGEKNALSMEFSSQGLPTRWLEAYHDRTILPAWVALSTTTLLLGCYLAAGGEMPTGFGLILVGAAGALPGLLLSYFIIDPYLARSNKRARLRLIARWEGRVGTS